MMVFPIVCSNRKVQAFIEAELAHNPYAVARFAKTAEDLICEAVERLGGWQCRDLGFWIH
jgi:hypothetical protein